MKVKKAFERPKFDPGDKVLYRNKNKKGTIEQIINLGDHGDIKTQGYRYEVLINRELYSLREKDLLLEKKRNEINLTKEIATFILPENASFPYAQPISKELNPLEALLAKETSDSDSGDGEDSE